MIQRFACRTTMRVIGRFSISTDINPWKTFFISGKVYDVKVNKKGSRNKYIVVDELGEEHSYTGDFNFFLHFHNLEETRDMIINDILEDGKC